jgi:RNA polymerase sigma-70 factor (ECF subfamily)
MPVTPEGEPADQFEQVLDPIEGRLMDDLTSPNPMDELISEAEQALRQRITDHIETSFAEDEEVTAVLIGIEQGMSARDVQREFNLTETQYDSARKRLRRFINKHYPHQWRSS